MIGTDIEKLTVENLKELDTKRLLNIKRIARTRGFLHDDYELDCDCECCVASRENRDNWLAIASNVKKVLASREHVEPRGKRLKKA